MPNPNTPKITENGTKLGFANVAVPQMVYDAAIARLNIVHQAEIAADGVTSTTLAAVARAALTAWAKQAALNDWAFDHEAPDFTPTLPPPRRLRVAGKHRLPEQVFRFLPPANWPAIKADLKARGSSVAAVVIAALAEFARTGTY